MVLAVSGCDRSAPAPAPPPPVPAAAAPEAPSTTAKDVAPPPAAAPNCQQCTFNARCQPLSDARVNLPCCEPIRTVLGNADPAEATRCEQVWKSTPPPPACQTCTVGTDSHGQRCYENPGNALPSPCCGPTLPACVQPAVEYVPPGRTPRLSPASHWTRPGDKSHPSPLWSSEFDCALTHDPCRWQVVNARECGGTGASTLQQGRSCYERFFLACSEDDRAAHGDAQKVNCP